MKRVDCKNCLHFREAPYQANRTGCWHPDNQTVTQKDAYLDEQQQPGDHRKINLRGNCTQYEERPKRIPLLRRIFSKGA